MNCLFFQSSCFYSYQVRLSLARELHMPSKAIIALRYAVGLGPAGRQF